MRGYDVEVPADCIATQGDERHARVLKHFADALRVPTPQADQIKL
jgi:hypothetical protein